MLPLFYVDVKATSEMILRLFLASEKEVEPPLHQNKL